MRMRNGNLIKNSFMIEHIYKNFAMIKIGLLKETKTPVDNRVALTPQEIINLQIKYPNAEFFVQKSELRAYHDEEYAKFGIPVVDSVEDCDFLFGIKEADINTLLRGKHYFFFGHIAKQQPYNRPLIKKMVELGITFSDYEYLVDDNNHRLCAFGWWAGVVGTYNSMRAYGIRYNKFELPKPDRKFTLEKLMDNLTKIADKCCSRIIVTGNGRVSQGAQFVLEKIGAKKLTPEEFLHNNSGPTCITYTVLDADRLVKPIDKNKEFSFNDFIDHGDDYVSDFAKYSYKADMLISGHFWSPGHPVYLDNTLLKDPKMSIKIIGDITCDIQGSIMSTLRSSTHDDPFYDFDPDTLSEKPAFSSDKYITVMAVDTCPNALAIDTSEYFGKMLSQYVFPLILEGHLEDPVIRRATILEKGKLTDHYIYLKEYAGL